MISDELRMYVQDWRDTPSLMDDLDRGDIDGILEDFIRIADRIDAEHAKAVELARMDGMDATFGDGWVKLPTDADGVPIHVGDEMTDGENFPARVGALMLAGDGWWCKSGAASVLVAPSDLRHVQPDSWERIIEDAAADRFERAWMVERCRRLAGEV